MTKAKTIRRWGLVVVAGLATVISIACNGKDTNFPTQPEARPLRIPETSIVLASFLATPDGTNFTLTVIFTDLSTGNIGTYSWDFGDGGTSSASDPIHTYLLPGTYIVVLTVSNSISSDSVAEFVTVGEAPPTGAEPEEEG